jgi:hypothetical protein
MGTKLRPIFHISRRRAENIAAAGSLAVSPEGEIDGFYGVSKDAHRVAFWTAMQLYRFDLEVKGDQGENQTPEILDKIVEDSESFWVFAVLDISQRANFGGFKCNMITANSNFEFLLPHNILLWPIGVVFLCDLTGLDDTLQFLHNKGANPHFFANKTVIPVVGVICIAQTTMRVFELQELVPMLS